MTGAAHATPGASRLARLSDVGAGAARPGYDPARHGVGIVHIGLGAFHRAHQAPATDDALAAAGGDWRIAGINLRSAATVDALNAQSGLYTLVTRAPEGPQARVIGAIARAHAARTDLEGALEAIADPGVRIVSLTVTEKGYGVVRRAPDAAATTADTAREDVAADIAAPRAPRSLLGVLAEGLRRRLERGAPPVAVLSCDNLPDNGRVLAAGLLDFAERIDPALGERIAASVRFPATMVDRITPAPTDETRACARSLTGCEDAAAVETEPFSQFVVEDDFPSGRPAWDASPGVLFVRDVRPFEAMKLTMLNGAHSMMAYAGFLCRRTHVRDVMDDPALAALVSRHLAAAAATLSPVEGIDFADYAEALKKRFSNPAIAHETHQIAADGTEKLPQRLLGPHARAAARGLPTRAFLFAVAAFMRYALGAHDDGTRYSLRDPREAAIAAALSGARTAPEIVDGLLGLKDVFAPSFAEDETVRATLAEILGDMLERGVAAAVAREAGRPS